MSVDREIQNAAVIDLKSDEGWSPRAHDDKTGKVIVTDPDKGTLLVGNVTCGYGFNLDGKTGRDMPEVVGDFWLRLNVDSFARELGAIWPALKYQPPPIQRALLNMIYQMGPEPFDGDGFKDWPKFLSALARRDYVAAVAHGRDTKWFREQTPNRAARVLALIASVT